MIYVNDMTESRAHFLSFSFLSLSSYFQCMHLALQLHKISHIDDISLCPMLYVPQSDSNLIKPICAVVFQLLHLFRQSQHAHNHGSLSPDEIKIYRQHKIQQQKQQQQPKTNASHFVLNRCVCVRAFMPTCTLILATTSTKAHLNQIFLQFIIL